MQQKQISYKILFACMIYSIQYAVSQDIQFSQFYASPIYLNPAFAGNTIQDRFAINYRNQWAAIPGGFNSFNFSYDHNFDGKNGLGVIAVKDVAGSTQLNFTSFGINYSYNYIIKRNLAMRLGVGAEYAQRSIAVDKLIFPSQLNGANASTPTYSFDNKPYLDFATGGIIYSGQFWAGFALKHITQPTQQVSGITTSLYAVPRLYSVHGGYQIPIKKSSKRKVVTSVTPVTHYKSQLNWDQADVGAYYQHKQLALGAWYRGIPFLKRNPDENQPKHYVNHDAVVLLVGLYARDFRIGYSYDITISKLRGNTAGSHEISLIYEWAPKRKKMSYRRFLVPCAKF